MVTCSRRGLNPFSLGAPRLASELIEFVVNRCHRILLHRRGPGQAFSQNPNGVSHLSPVVATLRRLASLPWVNVPTNSPTLKVVATVPAVRSSVLFLQPVFKCARTNNERWRHLHPKFQSYFYVCLFLNHSRLGPIRPICTVNCHG
jgi:hypothetical protein